MKYCFINGKILPENTAGLALNDLGVLRGYSVFEVIRTFGQKPFQVQEHLSRLHRSASLLGMHVPYTNAAMQRAITSLVKKNHYPHASIRIVITGGLTPDSMTLTHPTMFILVDELAPFPAKVYAQGVKLMTYPYQREFSQAKTANYITAVRLQPARKKTKAFEILYIANGKVLECSTSNIFMVKKNTVITPQADVLLGCTRNLVINLAKDKYKVEERAITMAELQTASEVFLTATNKDVVPVVKVDDTKIGNGQVGACTRWIMAAFKRYTQQASA